MHLFPSMTAHSCHVMSSARLPRSNASFFTPYAPCTIVGTPMDLDAYNPGTGTTLQSVCAKECASFLDLQ